MRYEVMCKVRLEEYETDAEQSEARNFLKKYKKRALKSIVQLLNCTLGIEIV